jgi:hypothetical protein
MYMEPFGFKNAFNFFQKILNYAKNCLIGGSDFNIFVCVQNR